MIILIDGYNVLKRLGNREIGERERQEFIAACARYANAKGHVPIIVFDAGSSPMVYKEHYKRVEVVYTGYKRSADDYIKEYVQRHADKSIMLVSADRELSRQAINAGAIIMEPAAFMHLITKESISIAQNDDIPLKTSELVDELIDELMQDAAQQKVHKEDETPVQQRKRPEKKLSRQERKLLQKIRKL
jgi:predicted RNA-binding protein with PIN domain